MKYTSPKVTPSIPSRFTAVKRHTTAIAYVPVAAAAISGERSARPAWLCQPPPQDQPYNISPEVNRIKMWCCGPRFTNACIPGARTTYPCAHGLLTMYLAGLVSRDPNAFKSVWNDVNIIDAGARSDDFNEEICQSHCG